MGHLYEATSPGLISGQRGTRPTAYGLRQRGQLRRWNLTFDEAYTLALENLRAATVPNFKEEGVYVGQWGDAYDASCILVPGIFDDLPITGESVFVLPKRDTMLVADPPPCRRC